MVCTKGVEYPNHGIRQKLALFDRCGLASSYLACRSITAEAHMTEQLTLKPLCGNRLCLRFFVAMLRPGNRGIPGVIAALPAPHCGYERLPHDI